MKDKRTYRTCVRIIVLKDNKIILGKRYSKGNFMCYEFPGGGIEENDSIPETVVKECLEEVGVLVTDVVELGLTYKYEINYPNPERAKLYRGGEDIWCFAKFVKDDKTRHDSEGDALPYTWETIDNAIKLIKTGPESAYNPSRLEALERVKKNLKKLAFEQIAIKCSQVGSRLSQW